MCGCIHKSSVILDALSLYLAGGGAACTVPGAASGPKWRTMVVILLGMKGTCYKPEWTALCWEKTVRIPCAVQMTADTKGTAIHQYPRTKIRLAAVMLNKGEKPVYLEG